MFGHKEALIEINNFVPAGVSAILQDSHIQVVRIVSFPPHPVVILRHQWKNLPRSFNMMIQKWTQQISGAGCHCIPAHGIIQGAL